MEDNKITILTIIDRPIDKVWEAWTLPRHIMEWNSASDDWHTPAAENDLRAGGKFSYTMAAKDGSFQFDFGGTYTEVIPNRKISYTLGDGRSVEVLFEEAEDGVRITETFDPENMNSREMQQAGWQSILDHFKRYTEMQER